MTPSAPRAIPPGAPAGAEDDAPPPLLGSWRRLYAAVLGWLALLIVLFYAVTVVFS